MSDQSKQFLDSNNTQASLQIFVDDDGLLSYTCDWDYSDEGLAAIAGIFHKLLVDNFTFEILEEIKSQCVTNGREGDYYRLINMLNNSIEERVDTNLSKDDKSEDGIVIPPDQVFNI
jgi:hypothetical protein